MKRILFLTHENIDETAVAKAMFFDIISAIKERFHCTLVSAGSSDSSFESEGVRFFQFRRRSRGKISITDLLSMLSKSCQIVRRICASDIVYIRSYPMMIFSPLARLTGAKVIFDTRGLFFDELFDSGKLRSRSTVAFLRLIERFFIWMSTRTFCVSLAQRNYYASSYGKASKYSVHYNGVDYVEAEVEDLRVDDKLVVGYVGSLISWHCPEKMKDIVGELNRLHGNVEFHCVTRDLVRAADLFEGLQCQIYECNYRLYPRRFDVGLCLIENTLSKSICFPVKLCEYFMAETPVIYSDNLKVVAELDIPDGSACAVSLDASAEELARKILAFAQVSSKASKPKRLLPDELLFSKVTSDICEELEAI